MQRHRLIALLRKEAFQIVKDPSTILISVVLPLFLLFIYGFGVSLDLNHLRIGVAIEDTSPDSIQFLESLTNSPFIDATLSRDIRELNPLLTKGKIRAIVVIPSYFSEFRKRKATIAPIQVITDGSETNTANFARIYIQGAFQKWLQQEKITNNLKGLPQITAQQRVWYNEQLESRHFLFPGSLAIIMTLIGTLLTALVVAREWERGTMEALLATPVTTAELIAGKLIPYFVLGMTSMLICIIVTVVGFDLPLRGSFWLLYAVSAVFLLAALSLGLMISTLVKNQITAYQISIVAGFLPAFILSGFLFEISSMPLWVQFLTYLLPARYFVQCLHTIFLVGNVWNLILFNLIPMSGMGLLFFLITVHKTVKRLD